MGEIDSFFEFKLKIGPWTERLYAVLPAGEDTKTPSEINFLIITLFPIFINNFAACFVCLKTDTSLIAIDFLIMLFFFFNNHF